MTCKPCSKQSHICAKTPSEDTDSIYTNNGRKRGGATFWRYNRCWYTTVSDRAFYDHVLLWNTSHHRFTFCTSNKAQYMRMLKSVESRHPGGNVAGTFVGKMFRYEFGLQTIDGLEYYAVTLSLRQ